MEIPHDSSAETQSNHVAGARESELWQANQGSDTDSDSSVSKKRKDLFAEVADLASEFNVPIAVVVSSSRDPSKFYGLGNISVEKVCDALQYANCDDGKLKIDEQQLKSLQDEANKLETEVKKKNKKKKKKGKWWEQDIKHMGLDELVEFGKRINELRNDVQNQLDAKEDIRDDQTCENEDTHVAKD